MHLDFSNETTLIRCESQGAVWDVQGLTWRGYTVPTDRSETFLPVVGTAQDKRFFLHLLGQWHAERGITSSSTDMFLCPSHLRIIAMGKRAVPLILEQMRSEGDDPDHWYIALESITGEDPVPEDAFGNTVKMAQAWLAWADTHYGW